MNQRLDTCTGAGAVRTVVAHAVRDRKVMPGLPPAARGIGLACAEWGEIVGADGARSPGAMPGLSQGQI